MGVQSCFLRKNLFGHTLGIAFMLAILSLLAQGEVASASTANNPIADDGVNIDDPIPAEYTNTATVRADMDDRAGATNPESQTDSLADSDSADDVMGVEPVASYPQANMNASRSIYVEKSIAHEVAPSTPPPENIVVAVNETSPPDVSGSAGPASPDEKKTAPGPKTSSDGSIGKPLLITAGVAAAVGVALAAGGGAGSDSSTDQTGSTSRQSSTDSSTMIPLADLVRIGDDIDYNANHPDHFEVSNPSGLSWSGSFSINDVDSVKAAEFKYTVAASKVGNPVYVNGRFVDGLCAPGNMAWVKKACSMDITNFIHSGTNEIKVKCTKDPSDTETPYDDVEMYDLRIELKH